MASVVGSRDLETDNGIDDCLVLGLCSGQQRLGDWRWSWWLSNLLGQQGLVAEIVFCLIEPYSPLCSISVTAMTDAYPPSQFSSVQSLSCVRLFATPWTTARQASLSITTSRSPPKPMSIELVMPSNHLILCRPLLLLPPIPPSIRVLSNESVLCIRWPKYWSFSFNISPSDEHPGLISFRMDWLDLLAVQGTLKSLLQHHSSKPSILLMVLKGAQLSLSSNSHIHTWLLEKP